MDVDSVRNKQKHPGDACRRCGQMGHWKNECPHLHDVRLMDSEELGEFLALRKDMEEIQQRQDNPEDNATADEVDFGKASE